ncbi:MAG: type II toxin-antitoxin system VapC family toxin [Thermoanaerobaculia bacterium]
MRGRRVPEATRRVLAPRETLHAPHLLDLEVAQVLRRYLGQGDLSEQRAAESLRDFLDLSVARYPHEPFLPRIWQLRANLTAYDAAYVALAEALDAPLVTRDARLARAAGHEARIELF